MTRWHPARGRAYVERKREWGGRCPRVLSGVCRGRGRAARWEAPVLRGDKPRPGGRVAAVARAAGGVQAACLGRTVGHPARLYPEGIERPSQDRWLHLLSRAGRGVASHIHADERYGTFRTEGWPGHHGLCPHRERALRDTDDARGRGALRTRRASGRSQNLGTWISRT